MFSFADKLKPFFSITPPWDGSRSPDPSTPIHHKKYSESDLASNKPPSAPSIHHSFSNTDFTCNSSANELLSDSYDSTANTLAIRSLLSSFQISLRILVMQQRKTYTQKPPVILYDVSDMTSACDDCMRVFYPEQMSELIFGNCYISTPSSGLKLQTLHTDSVMLSRVICHNAPHLIRSNQSSTQFISVKSNSLTPNQNTERARSSVVRCRTATSRSNFDRDTHLFNKPLSSSLDSKRTNPIYSSPANSNYNLDLWCSDDSASSPGRQAFVESLTSPHKLVSKTRRLAIVLIFHNKEGFSTRIDDILQSNFLFLENSINTLADNIYDVIYSTTEASFSPSLVVALEDFLCDVSTQLSPINHLSYTPLQLYNFSDCPVKRIPRIISNLHTNLNSVSYMENFFSRLLTAFLTYHHSWLVSMIPQGNTQGKLSSHIEGLASRYGYSSSSPFVCKVLLFDHYYQFSQELLSQLVILFSYLFRQQIDTLCSCTSPTHDVTPSNEDFLIISMDKDVFNSSTLIKPETNANNSNIQFYTYNPSDEQNTSSKDYAQVLLTNDTIFTDIMGDSQISQNVSILNYASSDRNEAVLQSLSELRHLCTHLELGYTQDELFPADDSLYELGDVANIPPPTLIIADLNEFTVEVIHNDSILINNWKYKETVLSNSRTQKYSRLVHRLVEMISNIMEPVNIGEDDDLKEAEHLNCEIALVCLENALADIYTKAQLIVKHLKNWLDTPGCVEDRTRTHELFSELIALLRVDVSDLELLMRIAYVIAPEDRNTLERLITFVYAY
ncbi:hypothetical protein LOD99_13511 [Oopsacas minuta]|uniref:Uncharacterized protein n=1 Tax=Oopsacas minuta TaxID=111878 RepID=A0AAV7KK12_9METZ|nr:hypothetical protein LOD99_13511 [Oopsacas minuta]